MNKSLKPHVTLAVITATALMLAACGEEEEDGADAATPTAAQDTRRIINVEVVTLQTQDFRDVIRLTGTVAADREVMVSAEAGGTVAEILVDKGTAVTTGQILVRLDDDLLEAQRNDARAQAKLAEELWTRIGKLFEEDGIGTESEYLQARYTAESATARYALMEERLQRTTIRAPFDGIFDTRLVEIGSVVAPGQAVGSVVDVDPLKVTAGVPERYAADVVVGGAAGVSFSDLDVTGTASVSYVGARVHSGNRTFPVELSLETPVAGAKPQMVADVTLQRRLISGAIVVPRQALVRTEDGYAAFVVESASAATAVARQVTQGPSANDRVVITAGLSAGDRIVVVGQHQVADGDLVRIVGE